MANKEYTHGFEELDALLRDLPERTRRRELGRAVRAGARVWRRAVRVAAPKHEGEQSEASKKYGPIRRNIRMMRLRTRSRDSARARVSTGDAFWAWFYEMGTRYQPARPFFLPAVEQSRREALRALGITLGRGVEKAALDLARRHGTMKTKIRGRR